MKAILNKKNIITLFLILSVMVVSFETISASNNKHIIEVEGNDVNEIRTTIIEDEEYNETSLINEDLTPTTYNETEFLIKDTQLRTYVNNAIGKSENYNGTAEEYSIIRTLVITSNNSAILIDIDTFEGLEYLVNLRTLQIMRAIVPESMFDAVGNLPNIEVFSVNSIIVKGDNPDRTLVRLNARTTSAAYQSKLLIPFDDNVDISGLANAKTLKELGLTAINQDQVGDYTYSSRGNFTISAIGELTNLTALYLNQMKGVDDPSFSFLANLQELTFLNIASVGINTAEHFVNLPKLAGININGTNIKDFRELQEHNFFTGASLLVNDTPVQYIEEKEVDGEMLPIAKVHTGIKVKGEIGPVTFTTVQSYLGTFDIHDYYLENEELIVELIIINPLFANQFNFVTGLNDIPRYGIAYGLKFKDEKGNDIEFTTNYLDIGKTVTYDLNYENGGSIVKYFNFDEMITAPSKDEVTRTGYVFEGWYQDKDTTIPFDFDMNTVENQKAYAKWEEEPIIMHTVTLDVRGQLYEIEVEDNKTINPDDMPNISLSENEVFVGWELINNTRNIDLFDIYNEPITKDIKLRAVIILKENDPEQENNESDKEEIINPQNPIEDDINNKEDVKNPQNPKEDKKDVINDTNSVLPNTGRSNTIWYAVFIIFIGMIINLYRRENNIK